jgi:hypothetical protein
MYLFRLSIVVDASGARQLIHIVAAIQNQLVSSVCMIYVKYRNVNDVESKDIDM